MSRPGLATLAGRASWPAVQPVGLAAAALAGCAAVALSDSEASILPGCIFRAVTGLDCPLCGATRGMRRLLRGHPVAALDYNLLLILVVPAAVLAYLNWAGPRLGLWSAKWTPPRRFSSAVSATLIVFGVVRNLPLSSLQWLRSAS